jgi:hypothetical protein
MITLFHRKDKFTTWRKSLGTGDPVAFQINGYWLTGNIVEVQTSHFVIVVHVSGYKCHLALRNEVYPINEISQAPQECDLGLTRPTVIHQVDHRGQWSRTWYKRLSGFRWLFSLWPEKHPSTMEPGGNSERG